MTEVQEAKFSVWLKKRNINDLDRLRRLFWAEWHARMAEWDRRLAAKEEKAVKHHKRKHRT